jgi:hypothetical protein
LRAWHDERLVEAFVAEVQVDGSGFPDERHLHARLDVTRLRDPIRPGLRKIVRE